MPTEIQQSPIYADYIRSLGWTVETLDKSFIFIKKFPFVGSVMKIQRVLHLPEVTRINALIQGYRVRLLAIEPDRCIPEAQVRTWTQQLPQGVRVSRDYYIPTKTIHVPLLHSEEDIFKKFSEAKRRAVRRAQKNNISVVQTDDIRTFIRLKNKTVGFMGFITTYGIDKLWHIFPDTNKAILVALKGHNDTKGRNVSKIPYANMTKQPAGGILLLFWDEIAYYWIAGATREGKKLFVPTLLVWEALKLAKTRGAKQFDFVGVWDERLPKQNREWIGFTKFKEGFGGEEIYYPIK